MSNVMAKNPSEQHVQRLSALNLCDVEQEARAVVDQARAAARQMLADAAAKAREVERMASARGERAGYEAGLNRGRDEGRAEALQAEVSRLRQDTGTVRQALIAALSQIEDHHHDLLGEARRDLLSLALTMAERICRRNLSEDAAHLQALLEEVIEVSGRSHGLILRINPADAAVVEQFLDDLHIKVGRIGSVGESSDGTSAVVCLERDERISRGGCIAERRNGRIDARLETQMERLADELLGEGAAASIGSPTPAAAACLAQGFEQSSAQEKSAE